MQRWTSSLSPKGQITVPVEVRRKLGLSPKDPVNIVMEGDVVRIESPLARLRASAGFAGRLPQAMSWDEVRAIVRDERAEAYLEKSRCHAVAGDQDAADEPSTIDERQAAVIE